MFPRITIDSVRAAVQAEIDALPPTLRYKVRFVEPGDRTRLKALVQRYCQTRATCGWEPFIAGIKDVMDTVRDLGVLTLTQRGAPACFQDYQVGRRPYCELEAMAVDDLSTRRQLEAIFTGAVPVYRALIRAGWRRVVATQVPPEVKAVADAMKNQGGLPIYEDGSWGRGTPVENTKWALETEMVPTLAAMETLLGL